MKTMLWSFVCTGVLLAACSSGSKSSLQPDALLSDALLEDGPIQPQRDSVAPGPDERQTLPDAALGADARGDAAASDGNVAPVPEAGRRDATPSPDLLGDGPAPFEVRASDAATQPEAPRMDGSALSDVRIDDALADTKTSDTSAPETGPTGLMFSIDIAKGPARQYQPPAQPAPISPYIYGINGFGTLVAMKTKFGLIRDGGDLATGYNWTNNFYNAGADYCYQQRTAGDGTDLAGKLTATSGDSVVTAHAKGEAFLTSIPIADYVASNFDNNDVWTNCGSAPDTIGCSQNSNTVRANVNNFPYAPSAAFVANRAAKGAALCLCAPKDTTCSGCAVSTDPVYQDEFVNFLKVKFAADPSPLFLSMDNEPNYWEGTHPEIWQNVYAGQTCGGGKVTYDDIVSRNKGFAAGAKTAWPEAKVFGPVAVGDGLVYAHSYADDPHWPTEFLDYYLQQMHQASAAAGTSLLDVLDIHYYTVGSKDADCVQFPRMFWDPNYTELSASAADAVDFGWDGNSDGKGPYFDNHWYPRQMIPRLQRKIAAVYSDASLPVPGVSFSEYNAGCETSIAGGVAEADLLGIFGREGVFATTAWPLQSLTSNFLLAAFDLFRNYDGGGAVVGDLAVQANTSDSKSTSVYAFAHSDAAAALDVVAINKKTTAQTVTIQIANAPTLSSATLYQLAGKTAAVAAASGTAPTLSCAGGTCTLTYAMPAMSATTIVLR
jgi:mannan endo-1,4-beta-mannosidase